MQKDIILIGKSPYSRSLIPWEQDCEFWGIAHDTKIRDNFTMSFEIHRREVVEGIGRGKYLEDLKKFSTPIIMREAFQDIPNSVRFPFEEVAEITGYDWHSSAAYMLSLAITKSPKRIGVYGFSMSSKEEYFHQRPNFMKIVGIAQGMGIDVFIPEESKLYTPKVYS